MQFTKAVTFTSYPPNNRDMLIGLGYKKGAGKDTAAEYLVKEHGFTQLAYADPLKRGCMEVFGLTKEQVYGSQKEAEDEFWEVTPRHILQFVGTDLLREQFDPDIWIKSLMKRVGDHSGKRIVVSDMRFVNETEAIKNAGGIAVRVDRDTGRQDAHKSETELDGYDGFDYVLDNSGTLEDLYSRVDTMLESLK